jgi:ATP-dependent Clp protease protease subunit
MSNNLELPKERNLYLPKQVNQESMNSLTKSIVEINEHDEYLKKLYAVHGIDYSPKPIKIYIDSYGGAVYQCFGLIGVMETSNTPIHTYVTGAAMSCGFIILIHGHERFGYEHSTPLYHQVSTGFMGKLADMEEDFRETKRLQKKIEKMTIAKTNITKEKLKDIYKRKVDWFMSANEALKLGVIDGIISK